MREGEQERARIVAYLKAKADSLEATAATLRAQGNMIEWAGASSAAVTTRMNADAIARNQHGGGV